MMKERQEFSLGVFICVWNRGEIFTLAFDSLLRQLEGIKATIWIFDNGSDEETRNIIHQLKENEVHQVNKVFFPRNMGIPYAANIFAKAIQENCDFTGFRSPDYILLMDADAYFKKPVADLVKIFDYDYAVGLVSGHDSIEHPATFEVDIEVAGNIMHIKEKQNERMITMLMRKEEFLYNYPFPHYRNRDVDWEITQWNPNSLIKRNRKLVVACEYVLHLGIKKSTWNQSDHHLESEQEISEVQAILEKAGIHFKVDVVLPTEKQKENGEMPGETEGITNAGPEVTTDAEKA